MWENYVSRLRYAGTACATTTSAQHRVCALQLASVLDTLKRAGEPDRSPRHRRSNQGCQKHVCEAAWPSGVDAGYAPVCVWSCRPAPGTTQLVSTSCRPELLRDLQVHGSAAVDGAQQSMTCCAYKASVRKTFHGFASGCSKPQLGQMFGNSRTVPVIGGWCYAALPGAGITRGQLQLGC